MPCTSLSPLSTALPGWTLLTAPSYPRPRQGSSLSPPELRALGPLRDPLVGRGHTPGPPRSVGRPASMSWSFGSLAPSLDPCLAGLCAVSCWDRGSRVDVTRWDAVHPEALSERAPQAQQKRAFCDYRSFF